MNEEKTEQKSIDFLQFYVEPHEKVSRDVTDNDMKRVMKDAHIMYNLCFTKNGPYNGGFAIAHPQIDSKDPLRFFITAKKELIINPIIIRHTSHLDYKKEGCMTYPGKSMIDVLRWHKGEVEFHVLTEDGRMSEKRKIEIKGLDAEIWQHEIDHLNGIYIYNHYKVQ